MTEPLVPPLVAATATVFMALIFARAALHKVFDFTAFTGFLADYELVPESATRPVAIVVALAELAVILTAIVPALHVLSALLAAGLLLGYGAAMAVNLGRGRDRIECGCGGAVQPLAWTLVWRNAVLAAFALVGAGSSASGFGVTESAAVIIGGLTFFTTYLLADQILANAAFIRLKR